jgi:hypothetical protein
MIETDKEVNEVIRRMNCLEYYAKEICSWIPDSNIHDRMRMRDLLCKFYDEFKIRL